MSAIAKHMNWQQHRAAVWREHTQQLRPVLDIDIIQLDDLQGLSRQKTALLDNTQSFLKQAPANHVLLWGSRGTGKSSLVKAVFNRHLDSSLRLIQIDKGHLYILPELTDHLRDQTFAFIIFIDDLAFEAGDHSYQPLKTLLEGSIERPPKNVLLYATSNRRHLVTEYQQDNQNTNIINSELHYSDAVEEKISLSDRFGLSLAFHPVQMDDYFTLVEHLFSSYDVDATQLINAARLFAMSRGSHSPRTAQQFYRQYRAQLLEPTNNVS